MDLFDVRKKLSMGISLMSMHLSVTEYARVSTDHLEQQKSLKNQVEHFEEMIKSNDNWVYVSGYIDEGISGTTDYKRDNFMRMIDDARSGKFDLIVTKEISRFSRNTLDSIKYTRELLSYGVAVLFVNDNINTALPDSELRLTIMASMAQDEIRRLSERVKFGMNRSIKKGIILGNDMLYGYKKNKVTGNLVIIPNEADVVKRLFSLYAVNNLSISKIAKLFNNEGIKTCQNKKWHISTLTRMLKNPKYKGYYCGKKSEIIDYMTKKNKIIPEKNWVLYEDKIRIPPIVEDDLWVRANDRLSKRNKSFGIDYKADKTMYSNRYPLSAKMYCDIHNEVFHRRKQCKSCDDVTWICAKYLKEGKAKCDSPNIRESEVYSILDDIFSLFGINLYDIKNILLELYNESNIMEDNRYELIKLKKERDLVLKKKDKLFNLILEDNLSNNEFYIRNNNCNQELSVLNEKIRVLDRKKANFYDMMNGNKRLENIINESIMTIIEQKELIKLLLDKIIVSRINNDRENIELKIFLNISKKFFKKSTYKESIFFKRKHYEFKRGYNTACTRRYVIKYQVILYI